MTSMTGRPVVAYADGVDSARSAPDAIAELAGLSDPEVLMGWTPEDQPWLANPALRGRTVVAGYALRGAVHEHRIEYLPVRLSAVPRLVAGVLRPGVAVVTGVRRGPELAFACSAGWGPAVTLAAPSVVVEVDDDAADLGGPVIPGRIVATIPRPKHTGPPPAPRRVRDVDLAIGRNVASLLPEEPTLQLGPGGVAEAIVATLDRPVRIWSGLVTDAMAGLAKRGLLVGPVTAAYAWGGRTIAELADAGRLRLRPVEETHDLTGVSAIERFVACNTALQVGLDGSVNIERVAGRIVAGIGGHADFCAAASRSVEGLSVIALPSTTAAGASTIVPRVDVVSTPRCDVELVVTEHGLADLRGVDDADRARRIARVAAPEHRQWLEGAATAVLTASRG
jgi:acyl-CoA hydrolase